ncbi:MAG: helix-turn-helix transcriptional regulator [Parafannyhessea sp.]|uniref:helix-turn-helix transcriptional regulator n=1 Tax=Parafannyhessea sp. TaxID=2847324 RepID=UPI003F01FCBE
MAADNWDEGSFSYEERNSDDLQALRLTSLMICLSNSKKPLSTGELRDLYYADMSEDAFAKKFQRDRKSLATCGIVVREVDRTADGALWDVDTDATFATDPGLSLEDATLIDVVCMPLANDPSFPYRDELTLALAKVNRSYTTVVASRDAGEPGSFDVRLADLVGALQNRHPITASYQARGAGEKNYTLALLGSFGMRGSTYFVACDYDRGTRQLSGSPRTFRLDRFGKVKPLASHTYQIPADFSVNDYIRLPFQLGPVVCTADFIVSQPQTDQALTPEARRAISSYGSLSKDGRTWTVDVSNQDVAAAWAIDVGLVPQSPSTLADIYKSRLSAAASLQPTATEEPAANADARARRTGRRGRKGGLLEARQLSALVGALDREGSTISANVVAQRLGCSLDHAKHLLSMLADASDDKSLYRLPLLPADDMSETVLMFRTLVGKPLRLTRTESAALISALGHAGVTPDDPLFAKLARGLVARPLQDDLPRDVSPKSGVADSEAEALRTCSQAIARNQDLCFDYTSSLSNQASRRMVMPHGVDHDNGSWYLEAFDLSRNGARTFRLDRMSNLRPVREDARIDPPSLAPEASAPRQVTFVLLDPSLADTFHWNKTSFTALPSGHVLARCAYFGGNWLLRRLSACGNAIAISDAALCGAVRDYASSLLV